MTRHRAPRPPRRRPHPMDGFLAGVALAAVTGFVSVLGSIDERHRVGVPVASRAAPSLPHSHAVPLGPPLPVAPFVAGWSGPVSVGGMVAAPPVLGSAAKLPQTPAPNVNLPAAPAPVEKPGHHPAPSPRSRPTVESTSQPAPTAEPAPVARPEPRSTRTAPDWWRDAVLRVERPGPPTSTPTGEPSVEPSTPETTTPETTVSAPPSATETTEEIDDDE